MQRKDLTHCAASAPAVADSLSPLGSEAEAADYKVTAGHAVSSASDPGDSLEHKASLAVPSHDLPLSLFRAPYAVLLPAFALLVWFPPAPPSAFAALRLPLLFGGEVSPHLAPIANEDLSEVDERWVLRSSAYLK